MKDSTWLMFNKRVEDAIREQNWRVLGIIYYEMAHRIEADGTDSAYLRDHGYKAKLQVVSEYLDNHLLDEVQIVCPHPNCKPCAVTANVTLAAEDARLLNPIPVKSCVNEEGCTCYYIPTSTRQSSLIT